MAYGLPRPPRRHSVIRCYADCPAQETSDPADCTCAQRDADAYDAACDARLDAHRNGDYDRD